LHNPQNRFIFASRGITRAVYQAHNLEVAGSNPAPAT